MNTKIAVVIIGVVLLGMGLITYNEYNAPSLTSEQELIDNNMMEQDVPALSPITPNNTEQERPVGINNNETTLPVLTRPSPIGNASAPSNPMPASPMPNSQTENNTDTVLAEATEAVIEAEREAARVAQEVAQAVAQVTPEMLMPNTAQEITSSIAQDLPMAPSIQELPMAPSTQDLPMSPSTAQDLPMAQENIAVDTPRTPISQEVAEVTEEITEEAEPVAEATGEKIIDRIIVRTVGDGVTVRMLTSEMPSYRISELVDPHRLVLDLNGIWQVVAPGVPENEFVSNVRLGFHSNGTGTRIVLDFHKKPDSIRYLRYEETGLDVRLR